MSAVTASNIWKFVGESFVIAPLVSGSPRMGQSKNIGKPLGLVTGAKCWSALPESRAIWGGLSERTGGAARRGDGVMA